MYGSDPDNYIVLFTHELETMTVDGSFDLNGDGKRELVVTTAYYEGNYMHYGKLDGTTLSLTVIHGCGA